MKRIFLVLFFVSLYAQLYSVTVDGYAFLEGQTDHSGIEVKFQRVVPDTLYSNTFYTDSAGYYSSIVESGFYDVSYSKSGFASTFVEDVQLYSDQTLSDMTLAVQEEGLSGSVSGVIKKGIYNVLSTITVEANDSLIIEPGAVLNFSSGSEFIINGYLKAEGTEEDSIYFKQKIDNWNGIRLITKVSGSFLKYCSIRHVQGTAISICNMSLDERIIVRILNSYIETLNGGICILGSYYYGADCDIENVEVTAYTGISFAGSSIVLKKCTFNILYGGSGLYTLPPGLARSSVLVENTIIKGGNYGIFIDAETNLGLYNSSIITSDIGLFGLEYYASVNACNNIILKFPEIESAIDKGIMADLIGFNNNVFGFKTNFDCGPYFGVIVTTNANGDPCDAYGNISMDPKFVDSTNGDFRLQSDSPCIDAGTNTITGYVFPVGDLADNYRIWDGDGNGSVTVDMGAYEYGSPSDIEDNETQVQDFTLFQNYPNPFNPETTIRYSLTEGAQVKLTVFDIAGREVAALVDRKQDRGYHEAKFNGDMLTSGMYFYRLSVNDKVAASKKMMLIK